MCFLPELDDKTVEKKVVILKGKRFLVYFDQNVGAFRFCYFFVKVVENGIVV